MGYQDSPRIDQTLQNLASSFPDACTVFNLNHRTHELVNVPAIALAASPESLTTVLFTGGVHARELAPPDALLSFAGKLLNAYATSSDIVYPAFTDANGVTYDEYTVDNQTVVTILDDFALTIVPCVNPDGRNYVLSGADMLWRKNRRPDPDCVGVDINRNFPFVWDADVYYDPAVVSTVSTSKDACNELFRGYPDPEPETQNLIDLVYEYGIQYLVDVHMWGRKVLYPWGIESDQSYDSTQTFQNTAYDQRRDALAGAAYGEYLPNNSVDVRGELLDRLVTLADAMVSEINRSAGADPTAVARSTYTPEQSIGLYPTTGAFDDYTFGQQFVDSTLATTCAFTVECGLESGARPQDPEDGDGGFWPDFTTQYPKVEREVHAALFGLLGAI